MTRNWEDLLPHTRQALFEQLEALYRELALNLAQLPQPCTSCGGCCNFTRSDHRLYASILELEFARQNSPPIKNSVSSEDICPYLKENKCSIRNQRMLGCRTYFKNHRKEEQLAAEAIHANFLDKIKTLFRSAELQWQYTDAYNYFISDPPLQRQENPDSK